MPGLRHGGPLRRRQGRARARVGCREQVRMARGELLRVRYASEAVDAAIAVAYAAAAAVSAVRPHRRED